MTSCGGRIAAGILTTFINVQKTTTTNIIGLLVHPPFRERAVPSCNASAEPEEVKHKGMSL